MGWALGAVAAAAALSGTAVVLQARAARRGQAERLHLSVALRLVRDPTYLVALLLVAMGFALSFAALRVLPVFVVQAGRSSSLAVAAAPGLPSNLARNLKQALMSSITAVWTIIDAITAIQS